jgi:hypothetical protein
MKYEAEVFIVGPLGGNSARNYRDNYDRVFDRRRPKVDTKASGQGAPAEKPRTGELEEDPAGGRRR